MTYQNVLSSINFDERGLVPAIAQQFDSGEVLMMAWMNAESLTETLTTGQVCYWSRSRKMLWFKGETSGQTQSLKELIVDCDYDTLLLKVDQLGVACHTGRQSCFFNAFRDNSLVTI